MTGRRHAIGWPTPGRGTSARLWTRDVMREVRGVCLELQREVKRVEASRPRPTHLRLVAATSRDHGPHHATCAMERSK